MVQNLVPSIREAADWDVLIGHYLGVDHVGHTYDVHSPHMAAKLQQMNQHVEQVRCGDSTAPLCSCTGTDPSRGGTDTWLCYEHACCIGMAVDIGWRAEKAC